MKDLDQQVVINSFITKPNYKHIPETAELFVDLGVHQFQLAFIHISRVVMNDPQLRKEIVPRKSDVIPYVKEGLQIGIDAGLRVMTEAIPPCFMGDYKEYIAELGDTIPDSTVYDADWEIENFEEHRINKGKAKGPKCKKCKYFDICEGPWKEYPEIFGWSEFEPVME